MHRHIVLSIALFLGACTTPQMQLDPGLRAVATPYPVAGREGWLVNQRIAFGEYTSGPVKRSWTWGYNIPFIVHFSGAKEQLGFAVRDGNGSATEIFCLGKLRERDLPVLNKAFEVNLMTRDVFTCSFVVDAVGTYDFYVTDLNQSTWDSPAGGELRAADFRAFIRPVSTLDTGQRSLGAQALGFEFVSDGIVVAAVETVNAGRVWLSDTLTPQDRLALASSAAALLLRSDLADHND